MPREKDPMPPETEPDTILPVAEERLRVGKRERETSRLRVSVRTETVTETVEHNLRHSHAEVERVPIGREIDAVPPTREENGVLIIPVVEEVLVVEKRLVLREEIRLRVESAEETLREPVERRVQRVVVERLPPSAEPPSTEPDKDVPPESGETRRMS